MKITTLSCMALSAMADIATMMNVHSSCAPGDESCATARCFHVSVLNPATSAYEPVMYEMKKTTNAATANVLDWRAASPDNFTKPQFRPSAMRVAGKAPWDPGTPGDKAVGLADRPVLLAIKDAGAGDGSVFLSSCDFASECPLPTCNDTAVIWEEEWQWDLRAVCPDRKDDQSNPPWDGTVCSPDNGAYNNCAWAGPAGNNVNGCASSVHFNRSPPELRKELNPTTVPGCPSPYCPISAQMKARASWIPEDHTDGGFTFRNKYRSSMFLALLEDNDGANGYVGGSPGSIQLRYVGSKFKFTEVLAPAGGGVAPAPTPPTAAPTAAPAAAPTPPMRAPTPPPMWTGYLQNFAYDAGSRCTANKRLVSATHRATRIDSRSSCLSVAVPVGDEFTIKQVCAADGTSFEQWSCDSYPPDCSSGCKKQFTFKIDRLGREGVCLTADNATTSYLFVSPEIATDPSSSYYDSSSSFSSSYYDSSSFYSYDSSTSSYDSSSYYGSSSSSYAYDRAAKFRAAFCPCLANPTPPPTRAPTPTPTFRVRTPKLVVRTKLAGFTVATFTRGIRFAYRRAFARRYNIADVLRVIITNIRASGATRRLGSGRQSAQDEAAPAEGEAGDVLAQLIALFKEQNGEEPTEEHLKQWIKSNSEAATAPQQLAGEADALSRELAAAAAAVAFDVQVASDTTADATTLNAEVKGGDTTEQAALVAAFKTEIATVAREGAYPQDVPANYVVPVAVAVETEVGQVELETAAPTPAPTPAPAAGGGATPLPIGAIAGGVVAIGAIAFVIVRRAKLSSAAAAARPSCSDGDVQLTDIYPGAQVLGGPGESDKGGMAGVL